MSEWPWSIWKKQHVNPCCKIRGSKRTDCRPKMTGCCKRNPPYRHIFQSKNQLHRVTVELWWNKASRQMSHTTHYTSHITHHTSHITHHTSHITHHTSHITNLNFPLIKLPLLLRTGNIPHATTSSCSNHHRKAVIETSADTHFPCFHRAAGKFQTVNNDE